MTAMRTKWRGLRDIEKSVEDRGLECRKGVATVFSGYGRRDIGASDFSGVAASPKGSRAAKASAMSSAASCLDCSMP